MENKNKKTNKRDSRFNTVKNYELLKVAKETTGFPMKISMPVPLTHLVKGTVITRQSEVSDAYNDLTDDESGDTS